MTNIKDELKAAIEMNMEDGESYEDVLDDTLHLISLGSVGWDEVLGHEPSDEELKVLGKLP